MRIRRPTRTNSLNSKLAAYSTTAVAALAVAPAANAAVENITTFSLNNGAYGTTPPSIATNGFVNFKAGTAAHNSVFKGQLEGSLFGGGVSGRVRIGAQVAYYNSHFAVNVPAGANIKAQPLPKFAGEVETFASVGFGTKGEFLPPGHPGGAAVTGYVAFKTVLHAKTYYGWLRVKVTDNANGVPAKVAFVAKNGVFGAVGLSADNLTIGAAVPEPSSVAIAGLGLLALGAKGVREMRRRRKEQEKN